MSRKTLTVTVCGLLQLDVVANPKDAHDVVDNTWLALKELNVSLSCFELECEPQILTSSLDVSDLKWDEIDPSDEEE